MQVNIASVLDSENKILTESSNIDNKFNTFFSKIGEDIAQEIKIKNLVKLYIKSNIKINSNSVFLKKISREEIKRYIPGSKESISFYNC